MNMHPSKWRGRSGVIPIEGVLMLSCCHDSIFDKGGNWRTLEAGWERLKLVPHAITVEVGGVIGDHHAGLVPPPKEYDRIFSKWSLPSSYEPHPTGRWTYRKPCLLSFAHSKVLQKLPLPLLTWQVMYWIKSHGGNEIFALKDTWLSTSKLKKKEEEWV